MQIVISAAFKNITRAPYRVQGTVADSDLSGGTSFIVIRVMCATNSDRDLNEPSWCRKYEKRGWMPSTIAIFILHHEHFE